MLRYWFTLHVWEQWDRCRIFVEFSWYFVFYLWNICEYLKPIDGFFLLKQYYCSISRNSWKKSMKPMFVCFVFVFGIKPVQLNLHLETKKIDCHLDYAKCCSGKFWIKIIAILILLKRKLTFRDRLSSYFTCAMVRTYRSGLQCDLF